MGIKKQFSVAVILICVFLAGCAAPKPEVLRRQLDAIADGFHGKLGYSLHHRQSHHRLQRFGDELFPTDSSLKVAILCAAMEKVGRGEIGYHDLRPLLKEDKTGGAGFFQNYKPGAEIEFKESLHQMITMSDNTATLMVLRWIGGTDVVNDWLGHHGFQHTRLIQPWPITPELERDEAAVRKIMELHQKWGMGVSTPNEMRTLMEMIVDGRAGTPRRTPGRFASTEPA